MWNRLTIGIALLSALMVAAVVLVGRLRDSRQDPFGGYSVDQVLPSLKETDMKRCLPTISGLRLGSPLPASFETSECADGSFRAEFVPDGIFEGFGGGVGYALPKSRTVALINIAKDAESAGVAAQEFEKTKMRLEDLLGLKFVTPQGFKPKHIGATMVLKEMRAVIEKGDENHQVVTIRIVRCKDDAVGCIVEFLDVEAGKRMDDEKDE